MPRQAVLRLLRLLLAPALALLATPAPAAKIGVVPIRIELASTANFCSLHVSNLGPDKVAVQVRGYAWSQRPDGSDQLDPADIRVNPAIMELAPGQKRLVRCSLPPHAGPAESAYRLLVDELPQGNPAPGTMQTVLRLSLPLFRKPKDASPRLHWRADPSGSIELLNTGQTHAIVGKLIVSRADRQPETVERGFYLLAGARRPVALATDTRAITKVELVNGAGQIQPVPKLQD